MRRTKRLVMKVGVISLSGFILGSGAKAASHQQDSARVMAAATQHKIKKHHKHQNMKTIKAERWVVMALAYNPNIPASQALSQYRQAIDGWHSKHGKIVLNVPNGIKREGEYYFVQRGPLADSKWKISIDKKLVNVIGYQNGNRTFHDIYHQDELLAYYQGTMPTVNELVKDLKANPKHVQQQYQKIRTNSEKNDRRSNKY